MNITGMQNVLDIHNQLFIDTSKMRLSKYKNKHNHYIALRGRKWNFIILSLFLNDLTKFKADQSNNGRIMKTSKDKQCFFFKFFLDTDSEQFIIINI